MNKDPLFSVRKVRETEENQNVIVHSENKKGEQISEGYVIFYEENLNSIVCHLSLPVLGEK